MTASVVPKPVLLPLDFAKVGRLVVSLDQPHEGYYEAPLEPPLLPPVPISFQTRTATSRGNELSIALPTLISTKVSNQGGREAKIELTKGVFYALDNSDDWFDEVLCRSETKKWLERAAIRRRPVYLIVGIQTVEDVHLEQSVRQESKIGGGITLPIDVALAAAGIIMPFGGWIDPEVAASRSRKDSSSIVLIAPGERICALQYRAVRYKWLSKRTADNAQLSKSHRWSCLEGGTRGGGNDEVDVDEDEGEGEDDLIEVSLDTVDSPDTNSLNLAFAKLMV